MTLAYSLIPPSAPAASVGNTWTAQQVFQGTSAGGTGQIGQKFINAADSDQWTWLQTGSTADFRNYLYFAPYNGSTDGSLGGWLTGRNAADEWIVFGKKDATHRLYCTPNSATHINSVGTGGVLINQGPDTTNGTGGLVVYTGGSPSSAIWKADAAGATLYQGSINVNRYVGGSGTSGSAHISLQSDTAQDAYVQLGIAGTNFWFSGHKGSTSNWVLFNYALNQYPLVVRNDKGYLGVGPAVSASAPLHVIGWTDTTARTAIFQGIAAQTGPIVEYWDSGSNAQWSFLLGTGALIKNFANAQCRLNIDAGSSTAQNAVIQFLDQGTSKWQMGKDSSNNFRIFDLANSKQMLLIAPSSGNITPLDGANIILGTTTGMKIGTASSQKLAFFNATPVVQPATTGTALGFTAGAGTAVTDQSTFTGNSGSTAYRISDIVLALKQVGLLAA